MNYVSYLLVLAFCLFWGCGDNPEEARLKLGQMGFEFTIESFLDAITRKDQLAYDLFLKAGMGPDTTDQYGYTLLMKAIRAENFEALEFLLAHGADPNKRGKESQKNTTPLFTALGWWDETKVVELLINTGADVNDTTYNKMTALMKTNRPEILKILIDAGADVNARNNVGQTALHGKVGRDIDSIELLLKAGADINAADKNGDTPLIVAAGITRPHQNIRYVRFLLENGANVSAKNKEAKTALDRVLETKAKWGDPPHNLSYRATIQTLQEAQRLTSKK